jgi:malate permease and related proteins
MINILLIFIYLFIGLVLQRVKWFPTDSYKLLNKIVIYICLPALALYFIPKIHWNNQLLFPIGVAWITFGFSFVFFRFLGKKYKWSKKLTGCLIITSGLGNTSFLGFPIIQALYGADGMKTAILVDQPGTFVVLSTLGILVATLYSKGEQSSGQIVKKIMFFPPFITFLFACFMNVFGYDFLEWIQFILQKTGSAVTPLALVSGLGLLYKLLLTPALIYFLYVIVLGQHSKMIDVSIMEAAMAPMITGSILAATHGLKPRLSSMMIGYGIPISFISLVFWYFILQWF